jgi:hypothetical protein
MVREIRKEPRDRDRDSKAKCDLSLSALHKYAIEEVLEVYSFPERFDTERSPANR